jgi:sucrose-6-phosphate hydrolase SacC (GH32 family)
MNRSARKLIIFPMMLAAALLVRLVSRGEFTNEFFERATAAVQAAIPRAQADPARPIFHIASPAQWMNDPNGPIYFRGHYHLFYQLTPFRDESGLKYRATCAAATL